MDPAFLCQWHVFGNVAGSCLCMVGLLGTAFMLRRVRNFVSCGVACGVDAVSTGRASACAAHPGNWTIVTSES